MILRIDGLDSWWRILVCVGNKESNSATKVSNLGDLKAHLRLVAASCLVIAACSDEGQYIGLRGKLRLWIGYALDYFDYFDVSATWLRIRCNQSDAIVKRAGFRTSHRTGTASFC